MSEPVQFEYELPSGDVIEVNALVVPGKPALPPNLNYAGASAEDPLVEITECFLKASNADDPDMPFDPDGLWVHCRDKRFSLILDEMEERALVAYYDS